MQASVVLLLAAVCEITGCFAFWAWVRLGRSAAWMLPGLLLLIAFATLLAQAPAAFASRAYAACGGIYIAGALLWGWAVEGRVPDRWDALGGVVSVASAATTLFARHAPLR